MNILTGSRNGRNTYDARRRAEAFIVPKLGEVEVGALTADMVQAYNLAGEASRSAPRMEKREAPRCGQWRR